MKMAIVTFKFCLIIAINIYLGYIKISKSIPDIQESKILNKCENGYTGINCNIATCKGYKFCNIDSICVIKNNNHLCVCRFIDEKGKFRQIDNCIRKYYIKHGVCYINISRHKLCQCNKNWIGVNCEKQLYKNRFLSIEDKINNNKIIKLRQDTFSCKFTGKNGTKYETYCSDITPIIGGACYTIADTNKIICACNEGYEGGEEDCNTLTCSGYSECQNGGTCYIDRQEHKCKCQESNYGPFCQNECKNNCGNGKRVYDLAKKKCICSCNIPYIPPDCVNISVAETTTQNYTNYSSTVSTFTSNTPSNTPTIPSSTSTIITTIQTIETTQNFSLSSETPTTHKTNVPTTIQNKTNVTDSSDNSIGKEKKLLGLIAIPIVIAIALFVAGLIFYLKNRKKLNTRFNDIKLNDSSDKL